MRRLLALLISCIGLVPGLAVAQEVRGRVVADGTRAAVAEADVALIDPASGDTAARTLTDAQGEFHLRTVAAGRYALVVRRLGYATWSSDAFDLPRGGWADLEIRLGIDAIPLEPVRVVATAANARDAFRRRMAERRGGHFITREQIDRSASARASDLLRTIPSVQLRGEWSASNFAREERRLVLLREGATSGCPATIYHDGALVRQSAELTIDDYINPRTLEAVEIYASAAASPAGYPAVGGCGVILFWIREQNAANGGWSWKRFAVMLTAVGVMALLAR